MNEHLQERFKRSNKQSSGGSGRAEVWMLPSRLNVQIGRYFDNPVVTGGGWLAKPELPTAAEVMDLDDDNTSSSTIVEMLPNRPIGPWESKEEYLSTQYDLYREDAIRGLREAVTKIRICPDANEDTYDGKVGIYEKVFICGVTPSTRGLAHRVTFSTRRAGKVILWEQSKRLIAGSLVVLTPANDGFKSKAVVATVAARPLDYLKIDPPELDLFFARSEDIEIDPSIEWMMIEDKGGLFEANRHTLLALQRMMREPFPLKEHILFAEPEIAPPKYIADQPYVNLSSVMAASSNQTFENVDVLSSWPDQPRSGLDASQLAALRRILTKRLAIVQGPPGTGKTHVSVQAVKVMLENRKKDDPPILVACQTNHAIDQFLRHVAVFEPNFVRLGGRSKDKDIVKKRTLFEVRKLSSDNPPAGSQYSKARHHMKQLEQQVPVLLSSLRPNGKPMDFRLLEDFKILTKAQADSLEAGASRWVQSKMSNSNEARSPFTIWLGNKLIVVNPKQLSNEHGFDHEEADLEQERLREEEAENAAQEEDEFDKLVGEYFPIADNFTCRNVPGLDHKVNDLLKQQDMWKIPEASRGAVYRHLQSAVKQYILPHLRALAEKLSVEARKRQIGQFEMNEPILKAQKVIGMTTTGLSKYRGLLASLKPKIVLIEEAAETLEAPVTVACMPSLQQLILVGDHQQLRPHTHISDHEEEPWYLNVSLFERMVNNRVEYSTLNKQRRMIPEIRRILRPIYGNVIEDHPSVLDPIRRPDVPGMGGINSFFFCHNWGESRDDLMSSYNEEEARMIAGFVEHLRYNDVQPEDITILTFYNGQRKKILSELRSRVILQNCRFTVVTVDSYQGEENKIVILSLVRSNDRKQIGFLSVDNRVCVALSRAQCGFYIFGNAMLLHEVESGYSKVKIKKLLDSHGTVELSKSGKSKTWTKVMEIMARKTVARPEDVPKIHPQRFDEKFPVRCKKHNNEMTINQPEQWEQIVGGCTLKCQDQLPCGHPCPLQCHPFGHDEVNCPKCRHKPVITADSEFAVAVLGASAGSSKPSSQSSSDVNSWKSFAATAEQQHAQAFDSYVPLSQQSTAAAATLVDVDDATSISAINTKLDKPSIGPDSASTIASSNGSSSTITPYNFVRADKKMMLGMDGAADDGDGSIESLVGERDGQRLKWKETFRPAVAEQVTLHKKDWSREGSLLD
ncbi:Putative P-loop containing nucleoside triphosphate hydrolase, DNA2/NAM7 helicase, helicase [Septoria linicola]|uniref:P-loop containing nucleoside triphosphate hydrolase, DNA2/NAM7 helicase, helicase n=1 Tax=Septoria linicola TaxID=215465 RepID=A0A9Q9EHV6_9PEZI|nr:putative P-loop containing nucleoside triphosphate hydrolase, DNA2/NAM7 helicase, helicase [Septoria linicola]USW52201.1 Putative P-loop containing nucleoside triphosphate hydrolase, DNA2/NAM7 helicase, helicase [Septoria linicola]